jgi:hypothetical protein
MKKLINRGAYKRVPQAIGSSKGFDAYQNMKDNPLFVTCQSDVDELKVKRDLYEVANAKAANGGKLLTVEKNKCYDTFIAQMDKVADKVEELADGDEDIATAAGFDTVKEAKSVTDLSKPKGLIVVNAERSGEAKVMWDPQANVVTYAIEYQLPGETIWRNGTYSTNSRNTIISGLPIEGVTLFRICALGRKGLKSEWTEPVGLRVI